MWDWTVELTSHFVQMSLRMHRQVGPLREVLSEQTIGVFIGAALPRTLRIAEVNVVDLAADYQSVLAQTADRFFR
jgi:hypothetical protein